MITRMLSAALASTMAAAAIATMAVSAESVMCPKSIETKQDVAAPQKPWESLGGSSSHELEGVIVYDGHPSRMASLVPDNEVTRAGKPVAVWTFTQTATKRIWLQCTYRGTSATLARQLDASLKSCEVTYIAGRGGRGVAGVADVQCK